MSALSKQSILRERNQQRLGITPFIPENLRPAGLDVTLADRFLVWSDHYFALGDVSSPNYEVDPASKDMLEMTELPVRYMRGEPHVRLRPGQFVLASTVEEFSFPNNIKGQLDGRSSVGRIGVLVHLTAGNFEPGFQGPGTLEIVNLSGRYLRLYPGMRIAQMVFEWIDHPTEMSYLEQPTAKYQNQPKPQASEIWRDFE